MKKTTKLIWTFTFMGLLSPNTNLYAFLWSDTVRLYNKTKDPIHAGLYLIKDRTALLVNEVKEIDSKAHLEFVRPAFHIGTTYKILASSNKALLKGKFYKNEVKQLSQINVSKINGSQFYLVYQNRKLVGLNHLSWKIHNKKETLKKAYLQQDSFAANKAIVTGPSGSEKNYIDKRLPLVKKSLEKFLGMQLEDHQTLRIGLCSSGGGFRAMFSTLGLVDGFNELGILDSQLYFSVLSGSSWMFLPWIASEKDFNTFKEKHMSAANESFWKPSKKASIAFSNTVTKKAICDQKISVIDWYGILLADKLLDKQFRLTLSDLVNKLDVEKHPFPICNATFKTPSRQYEWLEISPYEISSDYLQSSIPAWALGRKFKNGVSRNHTTQTTLGEIMGVLGSSFSGSIDDLFNKFLPQTYLALNSYPFYNKASAIIQSFPSAHKKFSPARFPNFTLGLENSPIKEVKSLEIVDGGYACNIPLVSLLKPERKLDIIFVLDNKQESLQPVSLKIAANEAKRLNLKMPPIDYEQAKNQKISIFKDENDLTCPVIVYIPLKKDITYSKIFDPDSSKFCSTYNFKYTENQASILYGLTKHIVISSKDCMQKLLHNLVLRK